MTDSHISSNADRQDVLRLARGGLLNLVGAASFGLLGFALTVVISRTLSPTDVGIFFEFVALYTFGVTLANLGTSVGLMRAVARARSLNRVADLRPLLGLSLAPTFAAGCVVGLLGFAFASDLAGLFLDAPHTDVAASYFRVAAPTVPFAAVLMGIVAATRGFGNMLPFNVIENIGQPSVRLMLSIGLFFGLANSWYPALIWAGPSVLALLVAVLWLHSLLGEASRRSVPSVVARRAVLAREFWSFTSMRFGASVLEVLLAWMGVLLVGALKSAEEAGIFAAASRYLLAGMLVNAAVFGVIGPHVGELLAVGNHRRVRVVYQTATMWVILITLPVYLMMAVFAPVLMSIFGAHFTSGADALVILVLGMLVTMVAGPMSALLLMGGRSSWNLFNTVAALAVNIALSVVLIPSLGTTGAAISFAGTSIVLNGLLVAQGLLLWRIHPAGPQYGHAIVAAAVCFGVIPLGLRLVLGATPGALVLAGLTGVTLFTVYVGRHRHAFRLPSTAELVSGKLGVDGGSALLLGVGNETAVAGRGRRAQSRMTLRAALRRVGIGR